MSKKFLFKFLVALSFVAVAVVWLLAELDVIQNFNACWLLAIVPGVLGVLYICRGLLTKTTGVVKKFYILFGALLCVAAVLALVGTFIPDNLALPIIAIILTVAVLLCVLAVGGKQWDEGDNQKVGYKNYYQRKAEKEKEEAKENN